MTKSVVIVFLLALPVFAQDQAGAARTAAGCGPKEARFDVKTDAKQHPMPESESGKSLIYVFQDERRDPNINYMGQHPTTRVGLDGAWIGANHGKSYFFHAIEPGGHRLCSGWQSSLHGKLGSASSSPPRLGRSTTSKPTSRRDQIIRQG